MLIYFPHIMLQNVVSCYISPRPSHFKNFYEPSSITLQLIILIA